MRSAWAIQGRGSSRLDVASAAPKTSVVVVHDLETLAAIVPAWEELVAAAVEPNVFYEPWMLLPALEAFAPGANVGVVLVLLHDRGDASAPATLGALFPLEWIPRFKGLDVSAVTLWQHPHCYDCTPLVRADAAALCLAELFRWLRRGRASASLAELKWISGDGPLHAAVCEAGSDLGLLEYTVEAFERGLWRKDGGAAAGPPSAVSGQLRRQLRRKERRLQERGRVEHVVLRPGDDIRRWIDEFLRLEASGWKGERGTALGCSDAARSFFSSVATSAFRRGRLLMLGLNVDGQPIARRCAFVAGRGAFAFKTGYDERFAQFSPGALLELDNVSQLQTLPDVEWMDSCATPDNLLVNRIANDRRTIRTTAVSVGTLGALVISGMSLRRWANRRLRKPSSAAANDAPHRPRAGFSKEASTWQR